MNQAQRAILDDITRDAASGFAYSPANTDEAIICKQLETMGFVIDIQDNEYELTMEGHAAQA